MLVVSLRWTQTLWCRPFSNFAGSLGDKWFSRSSEALLDQAYLRHPISESKPKSGDLVLLDGVRRCPEVHVHRTRGSA